MNDGASIICSPVRQDFDPQDWSRHRWGLSKARWELLSGKAVWVTGAGTGYGRAIVVGLAAAGVDVFLAGRRRAKLEESLAEIAKFRIPTRRCHVLPTDITDAPQVAGAIAKIRSHGSPLYGLVNSAAVPEPPGDWPLQDARPDTWRGILETNVTGSWLTSKAALALMSETGVTRILFMTSEAGWAPTPGFGPYNVSKAALNALCASFAAEATARHPGMDTQINALDPGEAMTEMNRSSSVSPYAVVPMALALLSHPQGGPNGCFFRRDGRHLSFTYSAAWTQQVNEHAEASQRETGASTFTDRTATRSGGIRGYLRRLLLAR